MTNEFFKWYRSGPKKTIDDFNNLNTINEIDILKTFDEPCQLSHPELLSSIGLNINQLYKEVLMKIVHSEDKGCLNQTDIIKFVQNVFNIDQMNHNAIYQSMMKKKASKTILNVEIVEGKHLKSRDVKSFLNPFCTLFISSEQEHKYNTSLKNNTLQPVWKEHFSLPVKNLATDILFVEVWNSNSTKTFVEKIVKNNKIKKGFMTFLQNIIPENNDNKNEIISITQIPLKKIFLEDGEIWHNLEIDDQQWGCLRIKLSLANEKNKKVTFQEFRHLLRILIVHQIKVQEIRTHSWMGNFLPESNLIIEYYVQKSNISSLDEYLWRWVEFINVHMLISVVNFRVFLDILNNLIEPIKAGKLSNEELEMFWQSMKRILPCCYNVIRTIRQKSPGDKQLLDQIENVLNILQLVQSLNGLYFLDLFPSDMYHWLLPCKRERDVKRTLHDAVIQSAVDWHEHILEMNNSQEKTDEENLKLQLYVIRHLKLDLQNAIQYHDKIFIEKIKFPYASTIFSVYDNFISERCEHLIECIYTNMKSVKFDIKRQLSIDYDPFTPGTFFFALYIEIQLFLELGSENCSINKATSRLRKYHLWFQQGVVMWLDIAVNKAMECIERAVESDDLVKVQSSLDFSISAVDTLDIFRQIITFWQQLSWPDVESSYSFMTKIVNDLCKCSIYYSDKIDDKVGRFVNENKRFEVTKEWCLAINNIDHIKWFISHCNYNLKLPELMESLTYIKSHIDADRCRITFELMIDNAVDILNHKIIKLLQVFGDKIIIEISECLIEVEDEIPIDNNFKNLKQYLDKCFRTLSNELSKDNFQIMFNEIIDIVTDFMFVLINTNLKKNKFPSYFRILQCRFHSLFEYLFNNKNVKHEMIKKLEIQLMLHTLSSEELIEKYYLQRLQEQNEMKESNEGFITVSLVFINNVLRIEMLNDHCIGSMDSHGLSDPSVMIRLVPQTKFQNVPELRTKIQKKTLYPFDDNYLRIPLTYKQRTEKNGIVMFNIENRHFSEVSNVFVSETFIHFKDISSTMLENDVRNLPQFKLNLTVPKLTDSEILKILEYKSTDELVNDFIEKIKEKVNAANRIKKNMYYQNY